MPESSNANALRHRDNILSAVSFVASVFLQSSGWESVLDVALERLGQAAQANRAYLFKNHIRDSDGAVLTSQLAEWVASGIEAQIDNPDLQNFAFVESGFGRWVEMLSQNKPIYGLTASFPESERAVMEAQQIQSLVVMPIFSQRRLWGFLGFDDCENLREWSAAEMDALFAAATALGAAIDRSNLEAELRFAQKMEAIGCLAAGVAHDFNNMLQAIGAFTRIAKSKIDEDQSAQSDLDEVLVATERANQLTQQLLSFSHKLDSAPKNLNLGDLCESVITMVKPMLGGATTLTQEIDRPSPVVYADSGLISQAMLNICLNAVGAMPDGGQLTIACRSTTVDASLVSSHSGIQPGSFALLTIRDTGSGMTREIKDRVFEPFFTTKPVGEGTGLGLSAAFGKIQQCGGFIDVESNPGKGSLFQIYLPLVDEPIDDMPPSHTKAEGGSETILFVDDEPAVLASVKRLIQSAGYKVLVAENGVRGLELYRAHHEEIQLVLTDSVMPEMDGLALTKAIIESDPDAKVILLSGNVLDLQSFANQQANVQVLQKPVEGNSLCNAIREMLDRSEPQTR